MGIEIEDLEDETAVGFKLANDIIDLCRAVADRPNTMVTALAYATARILLIIGVELDPFSDAIGSAMELPDNDDIRTGPPIERAPAESPS